MICHQSYCVMFLLKGNIVLIMYIWEPIFYITVHAYSLTPNGATCTCIMPKFLSSLHLRIYSLVTRYMGPTWGPPGSCRPQMGPMLAPLILLSGLAPNGTKCRYTTNFVNSVLVDSLELNRYIADYKFIDVPFIVSLNIEYLWGSDDSLNGRQDIEKFHGSSSVNSLAPWDIRQ